MNSSEQQEEISQAVKKEITPEKIKTNSLITGGSSTSTPGKNSNSSSKCGEGDHLEESAAGLPRRKENINQQMQQSPRVQPAGDAQEDDLEDDEDHAQVSQLAEASEPISNVREEDVQEDSSGKRDAKGSRQRQRQDGEGKEAPDDANRYSSFFFDRKSAGNNSDMGIKIRRAIYKLRNNLEISIRAFGVDTGRALQMAEILKSRVGMLHQETQMITRQRDADQQSGRKPWRTVGLLIKLSKMPLTESHPNGYQKPKPRDFQDQRRRFMREKNEISSVPNVNSSELKESQRNSQKRPQRHPKVGEQERHNYSTIHDPDLRRPKDLVGRRQRSQEESEGDGRKSRSSQRRDLSSGRAVLRDGGDPTSLQQHDRRNMMVGAPQQQDHQRMRQYNRERFQSQRHWHYEAQRDRGGLSLMRGGGLGLRGGGRGGAASSIFGVRGGRGGFGGGTPRNNFMEHRQGLPRPFGMLPTTPRRPDQGFNSSSGGGSRPGGQGMPPRQPNMFSWNEEEEEEKSLRHNEEEERSHPAFPSRTQQRPHAPLAPPPSMTIRSSARVPFNSAASSLTNYSTQRNSGGSSSTHFANLRA